MKNKLYAALAIALGIVMDFAILANAAHDIWAATAIYLSLLGIFVVFCVTEMLDKESESLEIGPTLWTVPVLIAFVLSFRQAITPQDSFSELMDFSFSLLAFFVVQQLFKDKRNLTYFILCLLPLLPIEFGLHLRQKLLWGWESGVAGTLINSNVSAAFHLFWVPVLFSASEYSPFERKATRVVVSVCGFCLLGTLALVQSTSALLCIILALPVIIGREQLKDLKAKNPTAFIATISGVILIVGLFLGIKISEIATGKEWSAGHPYTSRFTWWKSAWAMFKDHPWFGIGIGNYPNAYLTYKAGAGVNTLFPHSFIAGLLAETGITGILCAFMFFVLWLRRVWSSMNKYFFMPFSTGVLMVLLFCSFNVGLEYFALLLLLAIFMGISMSDEQVLEVWPRKSILLVAIMLAIFLIPYLVSPFMASQRVVAGFSSLEKEGPTVQAEKYFSEARELDSRAFTSYMGLAKVYAKRALSSHDPKEFETAINYQLEAIARNKLAGQLWWELGAYFEAVGDRPRAQEAYVKASQCSPLSEKFKMDAERIMQK